MSTKKGNNRPNGTPELMTEIQFQAFLARRRCGPAMAAALRDHYRGGLSKSAAARKHKVSRNGFHLAANARGEAALKVINMLVPHHHAENLLWLVTGQLDKWAEQDLAAAQAYTDQHRAAGIQVPDPDVLKGNARLTDS